jgi:NitT/TauT family transport system permease protein
MNIIQTYLLQPVMAFAESGFYTTKHAFTPNKFISRLTMSSITIFQLFLVLFLWFMFGSSMLPNPYEILVALVNLLKEGSVIGELLITIALIIESMLITVVVSFVISYLTIIPFFRPIGFIVSKLRFLTLVGLQFAFSLWMQDSHNLKVSLFVFAVSVFFTDSIITIIKSIERERYVHARTLRFNEWRVAWEVVIKGTFPKVLDAMRSNFAMAWMMLTMIEVLAKSEGGIGVMMSNQNKYLLLDSVFAIQTIILMVAIGQDSLIVLLKWFTCGWSLNNLERK